MSSELTNVAHTDAAYGAVAREYYDALLHPTCSNFNFLSRQYISRFAFRVTQAESVLEVGAGDSSVAAMLYQADFSLSQLTLSDLSASMLSYSHRWRELGAKLVVADAEQLDTWAPPHVDFIIAGLGDPYNTARFWRQIGAVLAPRGCLLFTTPSYEWASRFRGSDPADRSAAEFVTRTGAHLRMPSYISPLSAQIAMIEDAGLMLLNFDALGIDQLASQAISSKLDVESKESLLWGFLVMKPSKRSSSKEKLRRNY